jgi:transcriptional regulator GlxA family with amidase domain
LSFTQYVKELRLEKARIFLETTHLRVKEIRARVGATNETHFLRCFKQKFGRTPNQYRKFIRDNDDLRYAPEYFADSRNNL